VFGSIALKGTARSGQAFDGTVDLNLASVSSMAFSNGWPGRLRKFKLENVANRDGAGILGPLRSSKHRRRNSVHISPRHSGKIRLFVHKLGKIADSTSGAVRLGHRDRVAALRTHFTRHPADRVERIRLMPGRSCKQPDHPSDQMLDERANLDRRGWDGRPER
jgi:hypothetical protein